MIKSVTKEYSNDIISSISHTTRQKREKENNEHYHFVTKEQFEEVGDSLNKNS